MKIFLIGISCVLLLGIGITCLGWPEEVIHFLYEKNRIPKAGKKFIPTRTQRFLDMAERDPQMLSDDFPISIGIIRGMGCVAVIILLTTICGIISTGW